MPVTFSRTWGGTLSDAGRLRGVILGLSGVTNMEMHQVRYFLAEAVPSTDRTFRGTSAEGSGAPEASRDELGECLHRDLRRFGELMGVLCNRVASSIQF